MTEQPQPEQPKKVSKRSLQVRRVRGMQDFLPAQAASMAHIARVAEDVARLYGFERIATPILEQAKLFRRSLGLGSDVVMKEMYAFTDKNDEELCLRPEGTAGVIRALIDGGLTQTLPQRWFYEGPMFRRERPQKGRFRQFHQCGVELLDGKLSKDFLFTNHSSDVAVVLCAWYFMQCLGLLNKVILKVNWLGPSEERDAYNKVLQVHFRKWADRGELSPESMERLERGNAMRIFDSKNPLDRRAIAKIPSFHFKDESRESGFMEHISRLGMPFTVDRTLVRGLDYYNGIVFEFVEKDATREQATVLAGGRYDGLCAQLGGHPVRAVGWAAGLERLADLVAEPQRKIRFCFIGLGDYYYDIRDRIYNEVLRATDRQTVFLVKSYFPEAGQAGYDYGIARSYKEKGKFRLEKLPSKLGYFFNEDDFYNLSEGELLAKIKAIVDGKEP